MIRAITALALLCMVASGCASPYTYYCEDGCTPPTISGRMGDVPGWAPGHCGDCGGCDDCGGCADCGDCTACGSGPCGCPPLFGGFFRMLTCSAGCGEIYWGEWINDPPDECDPCDDCGNWIGPQTCCPPKGLKKLCHGFLGRRFGSCHDHCGCDDCAQAPPEVWDEPVLMPPETLEAIPVPEPVPAPSPQARRPRGRSAGHPHSRLKSHVTF
jgi:hypothetical protein